DAAFGDSSGSATSLLDDVRNPNIQEPGRAGRRCGDREAIARAGRSGVANGNASFIAQFTMRRKRPIVPLEWGFAIVFVVCSLMRQISAFLPIQRHET